MPSIRYKLMEFLFKRMVRPTMAKAAAEPEKFLEEQRAARQKQTLPLAALHKQYDFEEKSAEGTKYYVLHSRKKNGKKLVLYFFGGGFMMPGDKDDFGFGQEMADQTGAEVWLVWYRLLPEATEKELLESVVSVYRAALQEYAPEEITFFGLSSGGSLCLDVCVYIKEQELGLPLPGRLIPFSAPIQMPLTKEQMEEMKRIGTKDVMFPPEYVDVLEKMTRLRGAGELLGNSIAHSWKGFPPIFALYGSGEIYYAQLDALQKKCAADGVKLKTYVGRGMTHTWAAISWLPEAKVTRQRIYDYIKRA